MSPEKPQVDEDGDAAIQPYWRRWPKILAYPLQPAALSTVLALSIAHMLGELPGVGWFLDLVIWAAFFKYALEVLRWSANGREQAPEISFTVSETIGRYAVLLLIVVELLLLLVGIWWGFAASIVVGLLLMCAMPAIVMILALDEGMLRALSPLAWMVLGQRLGRAYWVLVGFFCAALLIQSVVGAALADAMPGLLATPLIFFVVHYLMIANFHLIGWVIHEHADELGYSGHLEMVGATPSSDPVEAILQAARGRAATGDMRGAATLLREELAAKPDALLLHDEYRHWLQQGEETGDLIVHGKSVIPVLLAQHQDHKALDIVRECMALDPTFTVDDAGAVGNLARIAAEAGQTQLALGLLAGFHKRFRGHPDTARNYLLAAKLFAERMNKEMQARALLQQIKVTMPTDPAIADVDAYLAFLDKLASTPAATARPPAK